MSRFRPCIDLHEGLVKQIVGGTLCDSGAKTNFVSARSAGSFARLYREHELAGGHVIRLGEGNTEAALEAVREYPGGLQVGGGIDPDNAGMFLDAGASHVIVTSYVMAGGEIRTDNLRKMMRTVGPARLVLDLSCRVRDGRRFVVTDRWSKFTDVEVGGDVFRRLADCCDEFLVHAVDVEGLRSGIDEELVSLLARDSSARCVYAGGIRNMDDIMAVEEIGENRVDYTVGSALDIFGGSLSFMQVLEHSGRRHEND